MMNGTYSIRRALSKQILSHVPGLELSLQQQRQPPRFHTLSRVGICWSFFIQRTPNFNKCFGYVHVCLHSLLSLSTQKLEPKKRCLPSTCHTKMMGAWCCTLSCHAPTGKGGAGTSYHRQQRYFQRRDQLVLRHRGSGRAGPPGTGKRQRIGGSFVERGALCRNRQGQQCQDWVQIKFREWQGGVVQTASIEIQRAGTEMKVSYSQFCRLHLLQLIVSTDGWGSPKNQLDKLERGMPIGQLH